MVVVKMVNWKLTIRNFDFYTKNIVDEWSRWGFVWNNWWLLLQGTWMGRPEEAAGYHPAGTSVARMHFANSTVLSSNFKMAFRTTFVIFYNLLTDAVPPCLFVLVVLLHTS